MLAVLCIATTLPLACSNESPEHAKQRMVFASTLSESPATPGTTGTTANRRPARIFIIFADVTRSLTKEENQAVNEAMRDVLKIIPPGSRVYVFPILEDVPRSHAIFT